MGYHIFEYAVAVGEGCEPFIDEMLDILASRQLSIGRGMVDIADSEDFVSYVCIPRI